MRICVIGAGYVGLVTAAVFADMGNQVTCLDIDAEKVSSLVAGHTTFYEPGIQELIQRNAEAGRLNFTTDYGQAVPGREIISLRLALPQC